MKTTLIFMRHGQVHNPGKVLYGRMPHFGLSKTGREQIHRAFELLKKYKIDFIYRSPLLRTRHTARILGEYFNLKPKVSRLLIEVKTPHQGTSLADYHEKIQKDLYNEENVKKGQESIESISLRMMKFIGMAVKKHYGLIVLAVSHGDPILIIKAHLLKIPFTWDYKFKNYHQTGEFYVLEIEDGKYSFPKI